jgi:hypothetical protein
MANITKQNYKNNLYQTIKLLCDKIIMVIDILIPCSAWSAKGRGFTFCKFLDPQIATPLLSRLYANRHFRGYFINYPQRLSHGRLGTPLLLDPTGPSKPDGSPGQAFQ